MAHVAWKPSTTWTCAWRQPCGSEVERNLSVFGDVFNVTNQGAPDSDWVAPVVTMSGPSLGLPTAWRHPRQLRVSVRLTY